MDSMLLTSTGGPVLLTTDAEVYPEKTPHSVLSEQIAMQTKAPSCNSPAFYSSSLSVNNRQSSSVLMTVRGKASSFRPETMVEQKAVLKQRNHQRGLSLVYSSQAEQCAGEGCWTIMCMITDSFMKTE